MRAAIANSAPDDSHGVVIEGSTNGPNVCIEAGTVVKDSALKNAIIGRKCRLTRVDLDGAILGDDVVVERLKGSASLGSHAEVRV